MCVVLCVQLFVPQYFVCFYTEKVEQNVNSVNILFAHSINSSEQEIVFLSFFLKVCLYAELISIFACLVDDLQLDVLLPVWVENTFIFRGYSTVHGRTH